MAADLAELGVVEELVKVITIKYDPLDGGKLSW